jgi:hypothetical protein
VTTGLLTVTRIDRGVHDGRSPDDLGLAFDRLAFRTSAGVGATAQTRAGWNIRYTGHTTLQVTLIQAGAWRTEPVVTGEPDPGLTQVRSYTVAYQREGTDLQVTIDVAQRAPIRVVVTNDTLSVDVLH